MPPSREPRAGARSPASHGEGLRRERGSSSRSAVTATCTRWLALGLGLKARGHAVTVLANEYFEPVVRRTGLDFLELGTESEFKAVIDAPGTWDPYRSVRLVVEWCMLRLMRRTYSLIEKRNVSGETVVVAPAIALARTGSRTRRWRSPLLRSRSPGAFSV